MFPGFNNRKRGTISRGDWDRDGVRNRKDCKPLDWRRQDDGEGRCKECNRYTTKLTKSGKCPRCAKADYSYSQGAMTLEDYKKFEKEWKNK